MAGSRAPDREALRGSPAAEKLGKVVQSSAALEHWNNIWWAMTGWTIAQAIRNPTLNCQLGGPEALIQHSKLQNHITTDDVPIGWPGFPAGTRFDPTDIELIQHLEEKIGITNSMPHPFINAFIPSLEEAEGICSKHPLNLPGIRMDGSKHYFFHKILDATGGRKRRKISKESDHFLGNKENDYWWHQTGKAQKFGHDDDENRIRGWKKIFVLKKGQITADWTIHQYHLGENPKEGELVLSKIFYSGLPPKRSSPPLPDNHILQDHQDEAEMSGQNDVADALQGVNRFRALIAAPATDHANLPHAGVSVAEEHLVVPYEEVVPQDPAEPAVPLDWWSSSMDVLPVPGTSSPDLHAHLPLSGTHDLGSSQLEVQLGSREGLESLLDYYY
ncbi:unnamed protein product [Urochloa decumbens]|uniref:NAC domain-containing protein n=1 Tax=Urochloa decumbens TaxID=240449 RepID=A0ABC9CVW9_9POAL